MTTPHTPLEIDCHEVQARREQGEEFLLLDCREPVEHARAKIDGATLIPMGQLQDRLEELEPHREAAIVVYCHHGGRSMMVTEFLRARGFADAQNMAGGIDAWSQLIDPAVPRY